MTRYVINFGDSWAHGSDPQNRYAKYVADELGCSLLDYSRPSTSMHDMVLQLQNFLGVDYQRDNQYVALFFVTAVERIMLFDQNQRPYTMSPLQGGDEDFYRTYYNDRLGEFLANTSLITIQTMCESVCNIQDIYMLGWQTPNLWPEVDRSKFLNQARSSVAEMFGGTRDKPLWNLVHVKSPYVLENDGHPSAAGHSFIADVILQHLALGR
jgi:hypothetical protein